MNIVVSDLQTFIAIGTLLLWETTLIIMLYTYFIFHMFPQKVVNFLVDLTIQLAINFQVDATFANGYKEEN